MSSGPPEISNSEIIAMLAPILGCPAADLDGYIIIGVSDGDGYKFAANLATTEAVLAVTARALASQLTFMADKSVARKFN